jgi:hypothetical protein
MFIYSGLDVLFDILLAYPPSKLTIHSSNLTVHRRSSFHAIVSFEEEEKVNVKHMESSSFLSRRILVAESIPAARSVWMNSMGVNGSGSNMIHDTRSADVGTELKQTVGMGVALVQFLVYDMLGQSNSSSEL